MTTKSVAHAAILGSLLSLLAYGSAPAYAATTPAADQALAKFQTAWANLKTYSCTIDAHEVQDGNVQDRTYELWFQKPTDTRMNIAGGPGRGGAAVWHGGDRVSGHQGGFLSFLHLNLDIHNRLATSIRGITIAEANFGAYLDKIKNTKFKTLEATADGDKWNITLAPVDPATFQNVARETIALGPSGLPVEIDMYDAKNALVVKNLYKDVKINVDISSGTFNL